MNFSKGVLECRKQTYKHLKPLLKPLPLETPTRIELSPGNEIQVTLFDANHCSGAVIFLIEGQGKAVIYTGDIRSEEWWVNNLIRHPILLPYTMSHKRLDTIYLDTTFATKTDPYRCFPSKASGLQELLQKLQGYPEDTTFYFQAWTFGYEEVWLALSQALNSSIHLDRYRYALYTSVSRNNGPGLESREAAILCGFKCGNTLQRGILTENPGVRLHSCERGASCDILHKAESNVVTITPIISRHAGVEMRELGAGGGQGDLDQIHELDLSDPLAIGYLLKLCSRNIKDPAVLRQITIMLSTSLISEKGRLQLGNPDEDDENKGTILDNDLDQDAIPLDKLPAIIAELAITHRDGAVEKIKQETTSKSSLPKSITFPYSRHSSYSELCCLVSAFRPRSVWPCTVPPDEEWTEASSMESLFGDICDGQGKEFAFDQEMREMIRERRKRKRDVETQIDEDRDGDEELDEVMQQQEDAANTPSEQEFESAVTGLEKQIVEAPLARLDAEDNEKFPGFTNAEPSSASGSRPLAGSAHRSDEALCDIPEQLQQQQPANQPSTTILTRKLNQPDPQPYPPSSVKVTTPIPSSMTPLQPHHPNPQAQFPVVGVQTPVIVTEVPISNTDTTTTTTNSNPTYIFPNSLPTVTANPSTTSFPAELAPSTAPSTVIQSPNLPAAEPNTTNPATSTPPNTNPPTSTTTTSVTPTKSPAQRLQARLDAFEKASMGLWHEVKLESVKRRGGDGGDEGMEEEL